MKLSPRTYPHDEARVLFKQLEEQRQNLRDAELMLRTLERKIVFALVPRPETRIPTHLLPGVSGVRCAFCEKDLQHGAPAYLFEGRYWHTHKCQ